jgi:hypothetical protein
MKNSLHATNYAKWQEINKAVRGMAAQVQALVDLDQFSKIPKGNNVLVVLKMTLMDIGAWPCVDHSPASSTQVSEESMLAMYRLLLAMISVESAEVDDSKVAS